MTDFLDSSKLLSTLLFEMSLYSSHCLNNARSLTSEHVMGNNRTFCTKKGNEAGRSLSPYLFIIGLETSAIKIRGDDSIKGITIRGEPVKLSLFADDMTRFIKDSSSYTNLFVTLKTFGNISLVLGNSWSLWEGHSDLPNLCNVNKILGVYFGYDAKQRGELNFRNTLKSCIMRRRSICGNDVVFLS